MQAQVQNHAQQNTTYGDYITQKTFCWSAGNFYLLCSQEIISSHDSGTNQV
jgi:hypothetical protein